MAQIYKNLDGKYYKLPENHPIVSLIYVLLFILIGAILFSILAIGVGVAIYGSAIINDLPEILSGSQPGSVNFIKIFQMLSSTGTFIFPCLMLYFVERKRTRYLDFSLPSPPYLLLIAGALMFISMPLLELSILVNLKMQLPEVLAGVEEWMKAKELQMEQLTHLLLSTTTYNGLAINLLMIAVLPAIGEELLFRGVLQNIFQRWTNNPHWAIWIVAILFSAIHMQFYGFLPRMLMGAFFGYLYYWGKSIWLPIFAHFVNNAYGTIYAFIILKQGKSIKELSDVNPSNWTIYLLSFIATAIIIHYFWKVSTQKQLTNTK